MVVALAESEAEYVHVTVAVDDGGWRAFFPLSTSLLVYRDGRIDKPFVPRIRMMKSPVDRFRFVALGRRVFYFFGGAHFVSEWSLSL